MAVSPPFLWAGQRLYVEDIGHAIATDVVEQPIVCCMPLRGVDGRTVRHAGNSCHPGGLSDDNHTTGVREECVTRCLVPSHRDHLERVCCVLGEGTDEPRNATASTVDSHGESGGGGPRYRNASTQSAQSANPKKSTCTSRIRTSVCSSSSKLNRAVLF